MDIKLLWVDKKAKAEYDNKIRDEKIKLLIERLFLLEKYLGVDIKVTPIKKEFVKVKPTK